MSTEVLKVYTGTAIERWSRIVAFPGLAGRHWQVVESST